MCEVLSWKGPSRRGEARAGIKHDIVVFRGPEVLYSGMYDSNVCFINLSVFSGGKLATLSRSSTPSTVLQSIVLEYVSRQND
jgi:hypothetical protein